MLINIINDETPDNKPPSRTIASNDNAIPMAITATPIMNTIKNLATLSDIVIIYCSISFTVFHFNHKNDSVLHGLNLRL